MERLFETYFFYCDCLVKIGDLPSALDSFRSAYDLATALEDIAATAAVAKAIDDVNARLTIGRS